MVKSTCIPSIVRWRQWITCCDTAILLVCFSVCVCAKDTQNLLDDYKQPTIFSL